jgi:hypothetical protein
LGAALQAGGGNEVRAYGLNIRRRSAARRIAFEALQLSHETPPLTCWAVCGAGGGIFSTFSGCFGNGIGSGVAVSSGGCSTIVSSGGFSLGRSVMPKLHVPASGALDLEVINAAIILDKDKPNSVFHPGGTTIVIHAHL